MSIRWGWFTAAVLAAALTGCSGGSKKDGSGAPPKAEDAPATAQEAAPEPAATNVAMKLSWQGEGDERKVLVQVDGADVCTVRKGQGPSIVAALDTISNPESEMAKLNPEAFNTAKAVVDALRAKRTAAIAAGTPAPKCLVTIPLDANFDDAAKPVMKAAFRAGFKPKAEVEIKAE